MKIKYPEYKYSNGKPIYDGDSVEVELEDYTTEGLVTYGYYEEEDKKLHYGWCVVTGLEDEHGLLTLPYIEDNYIKITKIND